MIRRRESYDMRLPKNLTFRRNRNAFYWRNPVTKKELSLGQISRHEAIAQTIGASHYIEQNDSPVLLLEKIKGSHEYTLNAWLDSSQQVNEKICGRTESIRFGVSGKPADVPRDPKPVRPPVRKAERQGICSKAAGAYNRNDDAEISQNEGEGVRDAVKNRISKFE